MKTILASLLLISSSAFAHNAQQICNKLEFHNFYRQANECRELVNQGQYFDNSAAETCEVMAKYNSFETLNCVRTIRNKIFNPGSTSSCKMEAERQQASRAVGCLGNNVAGTYITPPPIPTRTPCDVRKMKRQIDGAIENYRMGRQQETFNTLLNMQRELTVCVEYGL